MDRKKILIGVFTFVVSGMAVKVFKTILDNKKEEEIEDAIWSEKTIKR